MYVWTYVYTFVLVYCYVFKICLLETWKLKSQICLFCYYFANMVISSKIHIKSDGKKLIIDCPFQSSISIPLNVQRCLSFVMSNELEIKCSTDGTEES